MPPASMNEEITCRAGTESQKIYLYVFERFLNDPENTTTNYIFSNKKNEVEKQKAHLNCKIKPVSDIGLVRKSSKWSICRTYDESTHKCKNTGFKPIQDEDVKKQETNENIVIDFFRRKHTGEYGVVHKFEIDGKTVEVACRLPIKAGPFVLPHVRKSLDIYEGYKLEIKFK